MDENEVVLASAIAEISDIEGDFAHPLLTRAKFVFATDEGAALSTSKPGLMQGIKFEDFDEIIQTAVNMPIKMRYLGRKGIGGHFGSIPIGHITGMKKEAIDGVNSLVAEAVLYREEFPEEIQFLKEAFAAGDKPGISYEVRHDPTRSLIENGVEWLKGLLTQAATIVKTPAYGSRTAIMALASNKELSTEEFNTELLSILQPEDKKGGLKTMTEEEKKKLEEALAARGTEVESLTGQITTLSTQRDELTKENEGLKEQLSGLQRAALVESRLKVYTEAGFTLEAEAEKAEKKKEFLAGMPEESFNTYIEDLKAAKASAPTKKAEASAAGQFPKLTLNQGEGISLTDLKGSLRAVARGETSSE